MRKILTAHETTFCSGNLNSREILLKTIQSLYHMKAKGTF